jgi:hypothetical protein
MSQWTNPRRKRTPSDHQKRIRFLTVLFLFLVVVGMIGLFLLINLSQFRLH